MTAPLRRLLALALAPIAATAIVLAPSSAQAQPNDPAAPDEGQVNVTIEQLLDSTGRKFVEAKDAYEKSRKRQEDLAEKLRAAEAHRDALLPQVAQIAARSYRTGRLTSFGLLLQVREPNDLLEQAGRLTELNELNNDKLKAYNDAVDSVSAAKQVLDADVAAAQRQLDIMKNEKTKAESALAQVGGKAFTGGLVSAVSKQAAPAPRAADGSWPRESCTVDDPTSGGCITPRTKHMLDEVKAAGFDRFVGCWRGGDRFEHPKGRACDWSLQNRGFSNWHNEDTRTYGNNLMAFLVRNADRLGVLYVIWNRQIWFPATGWQAYSGDSTHEDHVHVSML